MVHGMVKVRRAEREKRKKKKVCVGEGEQN